VPRAVPSDLNYDGVIDGTDEAIYWEHYDAIGTTWHAGDFRGEGRLSFTARELGGTAPGTTPALPQTGFAAAGQLDIDNRFGYAGYIWDQHLGIYHVRHRAYDPFAGRWLQPDPLALMGPELLLALTSRDGSNLYAYVGNNPNGFVDPFGLWGTQLGTELRNNDTWWGPLVGTGVAVGGEFAESIVRSTSLAIEPIENGIEAEGNHAKRGGYEAGVDDYAQSIVAEVIGANELSAGTFGYDAREDRMLTTTEQGFAGLSGTVQVATAPIPGAGKAVGGVAKALGKAAKAMKFIAKTPKVAGKADDVVRVARQYDDAVDLGAVRSNPVPPARGWHRGDPIDNLTAAGNVPTWSAVRARYWKNQALKNPQAYTSSQLARMNSGRAPQRINPVTGQLESKELHHTIPQRDGGLFEVIEVWPEEHAAIDAFRHVGGCNAKP